MVRLNVAMLQRGFRIGSQHLLTIAGRRSGVRRSTPISIATVDGARYIVAAFPNADWVANARAASTADLRRGDRVEPVRLVELPAADHGPIVRAFLAQVRGGVRFFGDRPADAVVASAGDYPVFRVESLDPRDSPT